MASYELSRAADRDLTQIYVYSRRQFGAMQARRYLEGLESCFGLLAKQPELGRRMDTLRAGYLRFRHASHVVFYTRTDRRIHIVRVLHLRQDPERHL